MNARVARSDIGSASSIWRGPAAWMRASDVLAALLAMSLPWSTSLVAIFAVIFLLSMIPTFDLQGFVQSLKRPASILPVAMFGVALIGTLWATDIPWAARLQGINPVLKLLAIPLLIYHFERSTRGLWIVMAFFASCSVLLLMSWTMYFIGWTPTGYQGVPVRNYIAQSQEFALCAFGAAGAAMLFFRGRKNALAWTLIALALAFIANMIFVISSRTVLVCIPALLFVFALKFFGKTGILWAVVIASVVFGLAWSASPGMRERVNNVSLEYKRYIETNDVNSTAMRLEFWRKSIRFMERAPIFGHGTGATKTLFERDAVGQSGVSSEVIGNPHNQTLNVGVQWGLLGCVVLYAMWLAHVFVFQEVGLAAWIGLVAVVENIVSSIFNSHIFDFTEGWVYVLSVGVAAGMVRRMSAATVSGNMPPPDAMLSQDASR